MGAPVVELSGPALTAVKEVSLHVRHSGLHLALLDPFDLDLLDFSIIQVLARLSRPDLLIHLSAMDLRRNIRGNLSSAIWDGVAPGWRDAIDASKPDKELPRQFVEYWRKLVAGLGVYPSMDMHLIRADGMQPLYWLLLAAKHELALKLWKAAANRWGQRDLGLDGGSAA